MLRGVLNPHEPHSLPVMRSIITRLVGKAGDAGRRIFFSVPGSVPRWRPRNLPITKRPCSRF